MIKETKKAPTIRFRDFTDNWEQRKFRDMVVEHNAGIYINKKDYGTGINIIGVGDIYDSDKVDGQIYRLAPVKNSQYILEKDDIIYGESSLVPQGIARTMYVTKNGAGTAFAWHTRRVKLDKNLCNSHFITLEMNYNYSVRKYLMKVSTQTALTGMTTAGYFGALITLPTLKEQNKVSKLFTSLDAIILLHQRKLDQLKTLKKYLLQNMFPAKGEKVPRIRFKGFTGDWEQRKLGDCFAERRENMPDGELLSVTINDGIKKFSELGRHDNSNDDKSKYKKVCIGDIAYNSMRMWQGASGYSIYEGIVSPAYTVLKSKSNINSRFASYLFKCQEMMYTFQVNSQGITSDNWNLKFPALSQIKVKLPRQIYEQKKVADYLSNLDGFVVLHQRKLDQLQTMKKFMLQNMFI